MTDPQPHPGGDASYRQPVGAANDNSVSGPSDRRPVAVQLVVEQLRRRIPGGIGTSIRALLDALARLRPEELEPGSGSASPAGMRLETPLISLSAGRRRGGVPWDRGQGDVPGGDPLAKWGFPLRISRLPGPMLTRAWDRGLLRAGGSEPVVHAFSLAAPSVAASRKLSITVHDLAWTVHPEAYPERGLRWHQDALKRSLGRADMFVVPSQAVAGDLVEAGADPDRIRVIEHGSDHLPPADNEAAGDLLGRLGVQAPFVMSVSTIEPRKNLARLIEAFGLCRSELPDGLTLLVVGPAGWGDAIVSSERVVLAGRVSDPVLAGLYTLASALLYVPLGEGFGLPPLEAMRAGLPVVSSPVPSVDSASLVVDPTDVASIASGILSVLSDEGLRGRLIAAGTRRADSRTWAHAASEHLGLWTEMAREIL